MDTTKLPPSSGGINKFSRKARAYRESFLSHVSSFIDSHKLIDPNKKLIVSISGGVDSVALAALVSDLGYEFELLHFNHGTRAQENALEEKFIRDFAKKLNCPLHIEHLNRSLLESNFENNSRNLRKKTHQEFIKKNYLVLTAHHIDDSFEWSLMQSFKQSGLKTNLGIPVISGGIIRPFMCVSKKHILKYAKAHGLLWMEDASNDNEKFERNFLRKNLSALIQERYPNALKHYVSRSNQLAFLYNVHRQGASSEVKIMTEESGGVLFVSENFKEHKNSLKDCIHTFSSKARGEIDGELDKLIKGQEDLKNDPTKNPFKGPMNFSGGVGIFIVKDHLLVTNSEQLDFYRKFDLEIANYLRSLAQIPERAVMSAFPNLVISFQKKLPKSSKFIHPLLPVTCMWLKNSGISYTFTPLLGAKDRQMLANNAVILDSSVMGL